MTTYEQIVDAQADIDAMATLAAEQAERAERATVRAWDAERRLGEAQERIAELEARLVAAAPPPPARRRLPSERPSVTARFQLGGVDGYLTVGLFSDGTPGEVFVTADKIGSSLRAMLDAWATMVSFGLQYGVPLTDIIRKSKGLSFEPAGWSGEEGRPRAASILDWVGCYLERRFAAPAAGPGQGQSSPAGEAVDHREDAARAVGGEG